jgi:hypothetical protein
MTIDAFAIDPAREYALPAPPESYPGYREKFWVSGYDGRAGIGFSIWLETTPGDYGRWTESLHVVLPDGWRLTSNTESPVKAGANAGGQHAFAYCREPLKVWDYHVQTTAQAARHDTWPLEPLGEVRLALQLTLTSASPAFEVMKAPGARDEDATFGSQYRQFFQAVGTVQADGIRHEIDAAGFRARTIGAYAGAKFGGHAMVSVLFPSGRGAMYLRQVQPDLTPLVDWAVMVEGGHGYPARVVEGPAHLPEVKARGESYGVALASDIGRMDMGVSIVAPLLSVREHYFVETARTAAELEAAKPQAEGLANNIAFARFEADGEVGFGMTERSARLSLLEG